MGPAKRSSVAPSAMLNHPRYPVIRLVRSRSMVASVQWGGLEDGLDAAVLLVAEDLVHLGALLEAHGVRDHEARIELAAFDQLEELGDPAIDVRLARLDRQGL